MLYRKMPKSDDRLSILGFGCMRFKEKNGKIDEPLSAKQLDLSREKGINYFDTAMPYHMGQSELFLGRYIKERGIRKELYLATKLPSWQIRQEADFESLFNAQLKNLQTDYIDYYLIHNLDDVKWQAMEKYNVQKFLDKQIEAGRIRYAGFSFHGDRPTFKKIVDSYHWTFAQIQYNFLDTENQAGREGLYYAAQKELGIIIMEPLRGGVLAGKVPGQVAQVWQEAEIGRTPAEWSLRWIWNHPEVTLTLSGMNEEEQILENCRTAAVAEPGTLTDKELALVDRVTATYRQLMRAGCTGCRYCMPCPAKVNIPYCLDYLNNHHMYGKSQWRKIMYTMQLGGMLGGIQAYASQCSACGQCEKACPQHLPIQELLKETKDIYEGPLTKPIAWLGKQIMAGQRKKAIKQSKK